MQISLKGNNKRFISAKLKFWAMYKNLKMCTITYAKGGWCLYLSLGDMTQHVITSFLARVAGWTVIEPPAMGSDKIPPFLPGENSAINLHVIQPLIHMMLICYNLYGIHLSINLYEIHLLIYILMKFIC